MGKFEVTGHYETPVRGAFVLGHTRQGRIAPGMLVETGLIPPTLKIIGVECLSDCANKRHSNALIFLEKPSMNFLMHVMPVGAIVQAEDGEAV